MSNGDEYEKTVVLKPGAVRKPEAPAPQATGPRVKLRCLDNTHLANQEQTLEIKLQGTDQTIGRAEENSIRIDSQEVSRKHARLFVEAGAWAIEDLGSKNGILVNKVRVRRSALEPGDRIDIGRIPFLFALDEDEGEKPSKDAEGVFEQTVLIGKGAKKGRAGSSVEETVEMSSVRPPRRERRWLWPILIGIVVFLVILFVVGIT